MAAPCPANVEESCSLGLECKAGGKVHLMIDIGLGLTDNKVPLGNCEKNFEKNVT